MRAGDTNSLGETIRNLRIARGMTRAELAETVGISESHLNKIEAGTRQPGIATYQNVMEVLGAEVVIKDDDEKYRVSVQQKPGILCGIVQRRRLFI